MKTKKFSRKLSLNKRTVATLRVDELKNVIGGAETFQLRLCASEVETCNTDTCYDTGILYTCTCGSLPPSFLPC